MRLFIIFLCSLTLSGCAEYEAQRQADFAARAQAVETADDSRCQSYGAPKGSPNYVQCRMNLDNQHAQERQQNVALAAQNLANWQAATRPAPTYNVNVCNNTPGQVNTCMYR